MITYFFKILVDYKLFDDDSTLRVIISEGNTIELYNE